MDLVIVNPSSVQGPGRATGTGKLLLDIIAGDSRPSSIPGYPSWTSTTVPGATCCGNERHPRSEIYLELLFYDHAGGGGPVGCGYRSASQDQVSPPRLPWWPVPRSEPHIGWWEASPGMRRDGSDPGSRSRL